MRLKKTLLGAVLLAVSACSINDDLRQFRNSVPDRMVGLTWLELVPLGEFEPLGPLPPVPDARSIAARVAALRSKAASLRAHPVLDPQRARAMRAALRKYGS